MRVVLNQSYAFCQKGQREYQEDSRWPDTDLPTLSQRFFIVCDGVGGCEQGDVASSTVCKAMAKSLEDMDFSKNFTLNDFSQAIDKAFDALDTKADDSNCDMATTMVFVCFHAGGCTMAHIGDSRIYQYRKNEGIIYRSDDHSLVNSLVHNGNLSPVEADSHPKNNVITRYMSPVNEDEERWETTMVTTEDVKPDDIFILCSDGVNSCITDNLLIEILNSEMSNEDKTKQIAAECLYSTDNNTCIIIPVKEVWGKQDESLEPADTVETKKISKSPYKTIEVRSERKERSKCFFQKLKKMFNIK